jgi:osmoprotectant transport system permease protein
MDLLAGIAAWFLNPAQWQGTNGIPNRIGEHLLVSAAAVILAALISVPAGVLSAHFNRAGFIAVNIANVGRALPSMALLALALPLSFALGLGLGFWPTLFAMIPLAIPPIVTNSYTGIREVDPDVVDAARGMGMGEWQVLRRAELPLAAPLVIAGVRNAAVAVIATATLGALVAGGGLGRYIVDGLALQDYPRLSAGAILVALLAIVAEVVFSQAARLAFRRVD